MSIKGWFLHPFLSRSESSYNDSRVRLCVIKYSVSVTPVSHLMKICCYKYVQMFIEICMICYALSLYNQRVYLMGNKYTMVYCICICAVSHIHFHCILSGVYANLFSLAMVHHIHAWVDVASFIPISSSIIYMCTQIWISCEWNVYLPCSHCREKFQQCKQILQLLKLAQGWVG